MTARRSLHALFCLQLAALDLALRGPGFYLGHPRALAYLAASIGVLHLLAALRLRSPGRALVALLLGASIAGQLAFYRYYHTPFDDQAALAARLAWADVRPMLWKALPPLGVLGLGIAALEFALLTVVPERPHRRLAALVVALGIVAGGPLRHGTSEIRTASAATSFARPPAPKPPTEHRPVPPLVSSRAHVPNILYVITESVRASDYCGRASEPCTFAPEVHAALPGRVPLLEMRAGSAYTAISLSILLTGQLQLGPRAPIAAAPDLFDIARATRVEGRPFTVHYWSSQSPSFFERTDAPTAVDTFLSADTYLGHVTDDIGESVTAGLDRRVAGECRERFPTLAPPYLVVAHLSGTHAPYFFDESNPPYQPWGRSVSFSGMADFHRAYLNAIVEQDRSIATCVRAFLDAQQGGPHLIVLTSDHGESFGEHWAIHHGQSFHDEQVHVPAFIDEGGGAFSAEEQANLRRSEGAFVTHFDLLPTVLDAMGVLDHFALEGDRASMPGRSLLRAEPERVAPIPVTNCSAMWQCPLDTWGMFAGERKLIGQVWDGGWRCFSGRGGEHEEELSRCEDLVTSSRAFFAKKPNGTANE